MNMDNSNKKNSIIRTSTLFHRLFKAPSLDSYINENIDNMTEDSFSSYLAQLCEKKGEVRNQVIIRSGIERSFGHQIFRGVRNPSRDIVIRLAFGFGLDVDETQKLLTAAQKSPLFPRIKRDAAILYCINNYIGVTRVQTVLADLGLSLLEGEARNE
jgi:transcriptional regulator with XRE-family HTH domain